MCGLAPTGVKSKGLKIHKKMTIAGQIGADART